MWHFAEPYLPALLGLAALLLAGLVVRYVRHEDAPAAVRGLPLAETGYVIRLRRPPRRRRTVRLNRFLVAALMAILLGGLAVGVLYGLSLFRGYKPNGYEPRDLERAWYEQQQR